MICYYSKTSINFGIAARNSISLAGYRFKYLQDWSKGLDFINRLFPLQHGNSTLNSHAGIDTRASKELIASICLLVILHKNIVPDFKVLATMAAWFAIWTAGRRTCIDKHFRIRAAWAGFSSWTPPIVFARKEKDSLLRYANLFP